MANRVFMGRYEVVRQLGEGGMGKVYLARQLDNNQQVVVKVMHAKIASDQRFRDNFQREMQFMARFEHPNVVALLDASLTDPLGPCIIMEYIDGIGLDELLRRHGRLDPLRVGFLLGQMCSALQAAHGLGIIHRDLKLGNIMVMNPDTDIEIIKVMDFGLSKLSGAVHIDLEKFANADSVVAKGTPEYMCPEQVRGDELDYRGDLYSVGVMLYEMLTGRLPFQGRTTLELLNAHVEQDPPRFAEVGAADWVTPPVEAVVRDCLAKFPIERPQTARELAKRYQKAVGEQIIDENAMFPPMQTMRAQAPDILGVIEQPKAPEIEPNTVVYQLEAWMPERIAVVKLSGYVQDVGGEITESVSGKIRVSLGGPQCVYQPPKVGGLMSWIGLGAKANMIDLQLLMAKNDPAQPNLLHITALIRSAGGPKISEKLAKHPEWKACCDRIYKDLKSYLMGKG